MSQTTPFGPKLLVQSGEAQHDLLTTCTYALAIPAGATPYLDGIIVAIGGSDDRDHYRVGRPRALRR